MEFPTTYVTFTIPSGATTGARIVINEGGSGTIRVYDNSNQLVDEIGGVDGHIKQFTPGGLSMTLLNSTIQWGKVDTGIGSSITSLDGLELILKSGFPGGGGADLQGVVTVYDGDSTLGQDFQPRISVTSSDNTHSAYVYVSGAIIKSSEDGTTAEVWQAPTMGTGWATGTAVGGSYPPLHFRKTAEDCQHVFGVFNATSATPNAVIATGLYGCNPFGNVGVGGYAVNVNNADKGIAWYVNMSGELRVDAMDAATIGDTFMINGIVPLGNIL